MSQDSIHISKGTSKSLRIFEYSDCLTFDVLPSTSFQPLEQRCRRGQRADPDQRRARLSPAQSTSERKQGLHERLLYSRMWKAFQPVPRFRKTEASFMCFMLLPNIFITTGFIASSHNCILAQGVRETRRPCEGKYASLFEMSDFKSFQFSFFMPLLEDIPSLSLVPQLQTTFRYLNCQNRTGAYKGKGVSEGEYGRRDKKQEEWELTGRELQQQRCHRR